MILTGHEIERLVREGSIVIDPFDPNQINPNSYNYRLDYKMLVPDPNTTADPYVNGRIPELTIPNEGYVFQPNRVYLASTIEVIGSEHYVPFLIGRSSLGRLGVFLQISADLGNLGAIHRWTLEIVVARG